MVRGSNNLAGNGEDWEVACEEDSQRISMEIEDLRPQLDEDLKELGYCEQIEKLRVELALKVKENKELQSKYEGLYNNIAEILENQVDAKRKHLRQLERLYSTMEFPLAHPVEGKRMPDKLSDEDSSSKLVGESLAEKSGANGKPDGENLNVSRLLSIYLEVAKVDAEIHIKTEKLGEMLECEKFSEELGSVTVWKSIQTNMELQDIRQELIAGLDFMPSRHTGIGIKRMGEHNEQSLKQACRRKYGNDKAEVRAAMLASIWDEEVRAPSWHPFKIVEADGRLKEVVDDEDAKLKQLRTEYGEDVCDIVKTALTEMNEHNPSGEYAVSKL